MGILSFLKAKILPTLQPTMEVESRDSFQKKLTITTPAAVETDGQDRRWQKIFDGGAPGVVNWSIDNLSDQTILWAYGDIPTPNNIFSIGPFGWLSRNEDVQAIWVARTDAGDDPVIEMHAMFSPIDREDLDRLTV